MIYEIVALGILWLTVGLVGWRVSERTKPLGVIDPSERGVGYGRTPR